MSGASQLGRVLILVGGMLLALGLLFTLLGKVPLIGRLPGDLVYRRGNFTFYFPLATSLLISALLTLLLALLRKG